MYRFAMDQLAREDIAAAAAAHRELGPGFEDALAEGLVERIGAEIDKRVDARVGQRGGRLARRGREGQLSPAARPSWAVVVLGLGSMGLGIGASAAVLDISRSFAANGAVSNPISPGQVWLVTLIWIIIGVINVAYARRR
jgi:hypothetical protein